MPEEVKKSGGKGLLIGLIVLLLAGNILQFVLGHLKDEEQDELITTQQSSLDSLNKEKTVFLAKITQLETDLEQAIKDKYKDAPKCESLYMINGIYKRDIHMNVMGRDPPEPCYAKVGSMGSELLLAES